MLTLKMYREDKSAFFNLVKKSSLIDRVNFLNLIKLDKVEIYKDLIIFLEDIESIRFLESISFDRRVNFTDRIIKILAHEYNQNKEEYIDFINSFPVNTKTSFPNNEPDLYVLRNFLPTFYRASVEIKTKKAESVFNQYGSHFIKPYIWKERNNIELYYGKYVPYLIEKNPNFAKIIYDHSNSWMFKDNDKEIIKEALAMTDTVPVEFKLYHQLSKLSKKIGEYDLLKGKLIISSKYQLFKHNHANKKSLLIYGQDNEEVFNDFKLEQDLFLKGHDVLMLDARNKYISTQDIVKSIQKAEFFEVNEVYLMMHGTPSWLVNDVSLLLSKAGINGGDLFKLLVKEMRGYPIKAVIYSCHSQLLTHKIMDILPKGSEILIMSEDQVVEGQRYVFSRPGLADLKFNQLVVEMDLRKAIVAADYYESYNCRKASSHTYGKVGKCNFRTPVKINKQDLDDLFAKVPKNKVVEEVVGYLGEDNLKNDAYEYVNKLFDTLESANDRYPLLSYRDKTEKDGDFHKYLGVAGAIYALYDQCGAGYIKDDDFTPNQDNFIISSAVSLLDMIKPLYNFHWVDAEIL